MSKLRQQQVVNLLESLADQASRTIDILLNRPDVINYPEEKVEVIEDFVQLMNTWADEIRRDWSQ